jgi:hypothetical protein
MLVDISTGAAVWAELAGSGVTDHGALTGLADDDHPQYALKISTVVDHGTMGAAEDFDFTDGTDHEGVLDQNLTVTLSGATNGEAAWMTLKLTQDGTGTNTIDLPASVVNAADVEGAFDTAADAVNIISVFSYDGGSTWFAFLAGGTGGGGASDLDDRTDVVISSPSDGEVLTYDSGSGDWVNEAPAGGGGFTHTYLGYNTIGGSAEAVTVRRWYAKKITVASAGVITSIGAYVDQTAAGTTTHMGVGLFEDNAGTPRYLLAANAPVIGTGTLWLEHSSGSAGQPRWMTLPLGVYVTAGDYWIGVVFDSTSYSVFKDGSGADRYWTHGTGIRFSDAGLVTITTTTDRYSIRASHIA